MQHFETRSDPTMLSKNDINFFPKKLCIKMSDVLE